MEARTLAKLAIPRLERHGGVRIDDNGVNSGSDLRHLFVIAGMVCPLQRLWAEILLRVSNGLVSNALSNIGPPIHHQILIGETAGLKNGEVVQPLVLPPRSEGCEPFGIKRVVVSLVD